ncbi:hypothetical protein C8F01DRAFT_1266941 [Mycena amicta]|nr:hypothetical protein C8F01DRAFT_1266941 [Mycena amicta]
MIEMSSLGSALSIATDSTAVSIESPFPIPTGHHQHLATKTAHGVFNTPLNAVWDIVGPEIFTLLKSRHIRYSAVKTVRFTITTHGDNETHKRGPIVICISVYPGTTTAENAHDVSPDILELLKVNGVEGVVIEWYEGVIERLSSRPFFPSSILPTQPTTQNEDAQGSTAFYFHEHKDKNSNISEKVLGVSNCHVLCKDTTRDYVFRGHGARREYVRVCGLRRFQLGLNEITEKTAMHGNNGRQAATEIIEAKEDLAVEEKSEQVAELNKLVIMKETEISQANEDARILRNLYDQIIGQWGGDITQRNIRRVDWAPKITVDPTLRYTKDLATFVLDADCFKPHFREMLWTWLENMFCSQPDGKPSFTLPKTRDNRQLRISGCVSRELLASPNCVAENGEECFIVLKDGNTTDLTVGHYAGLEAFTCTELGIESTELAIYNYDKYSDLKAQ